MKNGFVSAPTTGIASITQQNESSLCFFFFFSFFFSQSCNTGRVLKALFQSLYEVSLICICKGNGREGKGTIIILRYYDCFLDTVEGGWIMGMLEVFVVTFGKKDFYCIEPEIGRRLGILVVT